MFTSILLLTIDRFELTKKCVGSALQNAGADWELLVCDNGSSDRRVIEYIQSLSPQVHILNKENLGIGRMYNILFSFVRGEYICIIDNDIELPSNWLKDCVNAYTNKTGMLGFKCVPVLDRPDWVFGTKFFSTQRQKEIGSFIELSLYGIEDSNYNIRMIQNGYENKYIGESKHLGTGEDDTGEYREMKNREIKKAYLCLNPTQ